MDLVTGAILEGLVSKLGKVLAKEYGLQQGVKDKIQSLSRELRVVRAILRKIGDVPSDQLDMWVRLWVCDTREASYKISTLIQDINKKLEEVAAMRGRYTADNIPAVHVSTATIDPRLVNMYKSAAELIGINLLSQGGDDGVFDKKMKIVSIVGSGGLGKTTLAKAVYDQIKSNFECAAFVPVGQSHDVRKVFRDILIALDEEYTYSKLNGLDENQLTDKLNKFVKERRFFIVIDDIWNKEPWKLIRYGTSHCASRLVITTRIFYVATCADEAYKIQPLSREISKKLLYARLVDEEGKNFGSASAEACDKILDKCGGVPLAIITIASLLATKGGEDWSKVYNSIRFGHEDNDEVDSTKDIVF